MTEISILMPIYARTEMEWAWCLDAVISIQEQVAVDIIVVDDCSPYPSSGLVPVGVRFYQHEKRRGPGAARNTAARAAKTNWLLPLDADDQLSPGSLEALWKVRCENEIAYGDFEWFGKRAGYQRTYDYDPKYLRTLEGVHPVTALHHRKAWQAVGGWNEHLVGLEDIDYWIKLIEIGVCPKRHEIMVMRYRYRDGSRHRQLENAKDRLKLTVDEIKQKHSLFFSGGSGMPECSTCPGGQAPVQPQALGQVVPGMVPDGWQELKYIGMMQGSFFMPNSPATGERYRIEGRGSYLYVHPKDVDWLINLRPRGASEFEVVQRQPSPGEFGLPTKTLPFQALPELPELKSITSLTQKEALAYIQQVSEMVDLRVLMAEESASPMKRKKVVQAIYQQMVRLEGENVPGAV